MLTGLLAQRAKRKIEKAIRDADLKQLNALLDKSTDVALTELVPGINALEYALELEQTGALNELLKRGNYANTTDSQGRPLIWRAIKTCGTPLAVATVLLQNGADANTHYQRQSLLDLASEHPDPLALPLLSRLVEYQANIQQADHLLAQALQEGTQVRVKFLIESGVSWQDSHAELATTKELAAFAKRIWQDKQLRDQWF